MIRVNSQYFIRESHNVDTNLFLNCQQGGQYIEKGQNFGETTNDQSNIFYSQCSLRLPAASLRSRKSSEVLSSLKSPREAQIVISESVITQLEASKTKLIEELKGLQEKYKKMQNDKLQMSQLICQMKNQINSYRANQKITEDQIYYISCTNNKLVDQMNFQRQLCNDYIKQNLTLKMTIKNIVGAAKQLQTQKRIYQEDVEAKIQQISHKMKNLKDQISSLRKDLAMANESEKEVDQIKQQLSHYVKNLQAERFHLKGQIRSLQEKAIKSSYSDGNVSRDIHSMQKQMQVRKIRELEEQNKKLHMEANILKDKTVQWFASSSNVSPRYHTNTQYLQKIMTENYFQVQNMKEQISSQENIIKKLQDEAMEKEILYKQICEQLERVKIFTGQGQRKLILQAEQEIKKLKKQNDILNKKNDQFVSGQKKLKQQICEKDKIIMMFVEQQKKNKQK